MKLSIKILGAVAVMLLAAACGSSTTPGPEGATASVAPGTPGHFQQVAGDRVYFETDQSTLTPDGRATLDKQVAWIRQYGDRYQTFMIEGHADERGTREYNLALGERRANMVRTYLAAQGVPAAKLRTISYGKERPEVVGSDEGAWSRNRRAVTVLQ
ncbi:peptidoglycan-associated lipoprotein Pal [Vineibacter terrae]|uniref:Peptidoglycan-associated lipoprotein n=1 Tax=Vineibacter terrae TaxID=2586908 RepID=A0A5C8PAW0_9HYPH|nr:peptidoglycan-associated lipoprotein Pal [Vineibacter terrae]TXL70388.1 peptidoglycan-associated lipoprotein Pal [Vineibacter terrae]HEX2887896.1 peptidoglycan-associated lipoprotein Pal [Vineibacter terrae]